MCPASSTTQPKARLLAGYASALRCELIELSRQFAEKNKLPHSLTSGALPTIIFEPYAEHSSHGNFMPESYRAIAANPAWRKRLEKIHTGKFFAPDREGRARELDSCASSDALLMNIFCHPGVNTSRHVQSLLGIDENVTPEFGFKARVPLVQEKFDRTEVDLRLGSLLIEAKLTEADFQSKHAKCVEQYRDLNEVFDQKRLPRKKEIYFGYQLIRNVLAAYSQDCAFCVLADERRPDLKEMWYSILQAVKPVELRLRCKMLTWQELAEALPEELQHFLQQKYGILAAGRI